MALLELSQHIGLVYLDQCLLVANKPAGLLAVPGKGPHKQDCLSSRTQREFPDALIVHRLDMSTSGLMIFARGVEMQRVLSQLFRDHKVEKRYVAIVAGRLDQRGEIGLPLGADWPNRPRQKVDHARGKHSLTRYSLLEYDSLTDTSRLELMPVTGRTHQLRVHLAAIGHAIVGDALYGGRMAGRMMLHASFLSFMHPFSGDCLSLDCGAPF